VDAYGDLIRFSNEGLNDIRSQTLSQQQEYTAIWNDVTRQLLGLIEQGKVDASVGQVLNDRDQQFRRESAGFDDDVMAQNRAMGDVQTIGNEGGAAMVRAASGGGR
jgi:Iap family predicted aminopeptidase